jgi:membrane associated rhomboid family serine protease
MSTVPSGDGGAVAGVPVCPRHPDRESHVHCQRCERPVCPDCQRVAAVGVQCVDCVRQQSRTGRSARTVFGGQVGDAAPAVTQAIIALCVGAYALEWIVGSSFVGRFAYAPFLTVTEPWRMITSAFLHSPPQSSGGALLHILFNMYAVWLIGPYLERLLGPVRFAALYLISAFGGAVGLFLLANPYSGNSWTRGAVGASGAVFGLFAALVLVNRRLGRDNAGIVSVIVINGVLGFMPGLNIAWQAHLGGLITGGLIAAVFTYAPVQRRSLLHPLGLVTVAVLLLALTLVKVALVPNGAFA